MDFRALFLLLGISMALACCNTNSPSHRYDELRSGIPSPAGEDTVALLKSSLTNIVEFIAQDTTSLDSFATQDLPLDAAIAPAVLDYHDLLAIVYGEGGTSDKDHPAHKRAYRLHRHFVTDFLQDLQQNSMNQAVADRARRMLENRYLLVLIEHLTIPAEVADDNEQFYSGTFLGALELFDLQSGKRIARIPVEVENSDELFYLDTASDEEINAKLKNDLDEQILEKVQALSGVLFHEPVGIPGIN